MKTNGYIPCGPLVAWVLNLVITRGVEFDGVEERGP
jgi:hypothetical protein